MSGSEIAHIIDQFESSVLGNSSDSGQYCHHTETRTEQIRIQKTNAMIQVIDELGNPFEEMHGDLLALDTRDCTVPSIITAFDKLKEHGSTQYKNFIKNVLLSNKQSIHDPIKRNEFQLFKEPKRRSVKQNDQNLCNSSALFGRMYIANQHRQGDPLIFFSHENQLEPPAISENGQLRKSDKAKLLNCIGEKYREAADDQFDCLLIDGGTMLNTLLPTGIKSFQDFANQCFLKAAQRLDIVWDQYFDQSIKSDTRLARGSGTRRKVAPKTRLPTERSYSWKKFLRNNQNKQVLVKYFNEVAVASVSTLFKTKWVNLTDESNVIPLGKAQHMDSCDIEEADSRIIVHMVDAA